MDRQGRKGKLSRLPKGATESQGFPKRVRGRNGNRFPGREESLRLGKERQLREQRQEKERRRERQEEVESKRHYQLTLNKKGRRREETEREGTRKREASKALGVSVMREEAMLDAKKRRARVIRAQEEEIKEMNKESQRYATRMNEYTLERGREWQKTQMNHEERGYTQNTRDHLYRDEQKNQTA